MLHDLSVLETNIHRHLDAIDLLLANNMRMPALVLIYSGIDVLAALNRPLSNVDVTRGDFVDWCDQYLVMAGFQQCKPIELYAARCAIIHTYSSESSLSRKGAARAIVYAWGNHPPKPLQDVIDSVGIETIVVIHIDNLAQALRLSANLFLDEVRSNPNLLDKVAVRGQAFFDEHTDVLPHAN
jgi:hypothetical protein